MTSIQSPTHARAIVRAWLFASLMLLACAACARQGPDAMTTSTSNKTFADDVSGRLADAVKRGDGGLIKELIAGGANPNAQGDNGLPMLQYAMLNDSRKGFEALLAAGADPARGDKDGRTALHLAAMADTSHWLETLLEHGASADTPNTVTGATPLAAALDARREGNVERLLKAGANPDAADRQGQTALHHAALVNDTSAVLTLLEAGADPRAKDRTGGTFQAYLFMADEKMLNAGARRDLDAVREWLLAHDVPIEGADAH